MRKIPRCLLRLYIFLTFSFVLFVVVNAYENDITWYIDSAVILTRKTLGLI